MRELDAQSRDDKAEYAYAIWSTEAGGDTQKTAELCGIPRSTVQRYMREDGWERRLEQERFGDESEAVMEAARMMRRAMPSVVERQIAIAAGTKPLINSEGKLVINPDTGKVVMIPLAENKDSTNAARWLMQYGMMSAIDVLRDGASPSAYDTPYGTSGNGSVASGSSTAEQVRNIINANYQDASSRKGPKRR